MEQILARIRGANIFSKLYADHGISYVKLAPGCCLLTKFITPFGRLRIKHVPFGITSTPFLARVGTGSNQQIPFHFFCLRTALSQYDEALAEMTASHARQYLAGTSLEVRLSGLWMLFLFNTCVSPQNRCFFFTQKVVKWLCFSCQMQKEFAHLVGHSKEMA